MYPKKIVDFAEDIVYDIFSEEALSSELIADGLDFELFKENVKKHGLELFLRGDEPSFSKEDFLKIIEQTLLEGALNGLMEKKLIDAIDNENGETIYFGTKKLTSLLKNC